MSRPISLYLVVPPSDKIRLRPLIRLMFTMIVNRLTERMDFEGSAQKRNRHRLLFMIDEFPSLKRMEIFADALSYMAGYGLKAYLITQDIRQIVDEYGPNESIVSNCHVRVAYAPNQYDTAELLSKMTGTKTVQKASFNFSGSRLAPIANHMSASVEQIERPLMTPDEVMRLKPSKKSGSGDVGADSRPRRHADLRQRPSPDPRNSDPLFLRSGLVEARGDPAPDGVHNHRGRPRESAKSSGPHGKRNQQTGSHLRSRSRRWNVPS